MRSCDTCRFYLLLFFKWNFFILIKGVVANLHVHSFLPLWPHPQWGFCSPWTLGNISIKKEEVQSLPTPQALCTHFAHRCPKAFYATMDSEQLGKNLVLSLWPHHWGLYKPHTYLPPWLPFWRLMPQCFMSQDWTGPSYPLDTAGGRSSGFWWGVLGLGTPLKKVENPAFLSPLPQDSILCSYQFGEGKP